MQTNASAEHVANQTLPTDSTTPYFISSNRGPKYLQRSSGQVIAQLASGVQTKSLLSMATIAIKPGQPSASQRFEVHQAIQVTEGMLSINMQGQTHQLIFGDLAFIPEGTSFTYWSTVGFTKFITWSAGPGLADALIKTAEPWAYGVWPA